MWSIVPNPRRRYRLEVSGRRGGFAFSRLSDALRVGESVELSRAVALVQVYADGREVVRYVSPPGVVGTPGRRSGRSR